jgi:peptidoglycan hydrolase-like protein with peptidoglycan-binding domain
MRTFVSALISTAFCLPCAALADEITSLHPEQAYPDNAAPASQDRYAGFVEDIQKKLHENGFDAGPVNGVFDSKTQAALAQFQLSRTLPVSGMLDERTLAELGVAPPPSETAAASEPPPSEPASASAEPSSSTGPSSEPSR